MNEKARRFYLNLSVALMIIGALVIIIEILERVMRFTFFAGNIFTLALLILIVGIVLYRTAKNAPPEEQSDEQP
jgi:uncharacterized membrane protein YwaF